jgi:hypothetical protein
VCRYEQVSENGDFEYHEIPDMTHLLRAEAGKPGLAGYKEQAKRPVDPRFLQFIGDWLEKHIAG